MAVPDIEVIRRIAPVDKVKAAHAGLLYSRSDGAIEEVRQKGHPAAERCTGRDSPSGDILMHLKINEGEFASE
jgi:hypothetical protein